MSKNLQILLFRRKRFDERIRSNHITRMCSELIEDVVGRVRTPTPPPPDFTLQENREIEFEKINRDRLLWYSESSYNLFLQLQSELKELLTLDEEDDWGFSVKQLKEWIKQLEDPKTKRQMLERWKSYVYLSRKKPINKLPLYSTTKVIL